MAQVIRADLDEIVFENREKRYGGYVLRKNYQRYLTFGFLIAFGLTAMGVVGPYIYGKIQEYVEANAPKEVEVDLSNLPDTPPEEKPPEEVLPPPPPPPEELPPPPVEQVAVKLPVPKPPDQIKEEEVIVQVDSMDNKKAALENKEGVKAENANAPVPEKTEPKGTGEAPKVISEPPPPPPPPKKEEEPDPTKFIPGAKQPKEVNLGDIQKLIGYPAVAREMNLEGNIVFRVLVDENGSYVKHLPPKSGHPILIKAVEEHIGKVKFTPAIQGDKPIKFWVNVPFVFKLQ